MSLRPAWITLWLPGQLGLHSETLQKEEERRERPKGGNPSFAEEVLRTVLFHAPLHHFYPHKHLGVQKSRTWLPWRSSPEALKPLSPDSAPPALGDASVGNPVSLRHLHMSCERGVLPVLHPTHPAPTADEDAPCPSRSQKDKGGEGIRNGKEVAQGQRKISC